MFVLFSVEARARALIKLNCFIVIYRLEISLYQRYIYFPGLPPGLVDGL